MTDDATPAERSQPDGLVGAFERLDTTREALERRRVFSALHDRMFGSGDAVRVGRFVLRAKLGAGGMGTVYAAHDPELDRQVAIKILHAEGGDVEAIARLEREARALAKLRHPNVVAVHEVGEHDGQRFIAMDLVEGQTLRAWIDARPGWREAVALLLEAGRGLAAAHAAGLVHRDFKPDNVLVEGGHARVVDFGLARPQLATPIPTAHGDDTITDEITRTGAMLGTPAYMSPEAFLGAVDARSDQFAFCVVLYEAIYGVRPFAGGTVAALCAAVAGGEITRPSPEVRVPARLRRAIVRGLAAVPERRWPDMDALLDELARHTRRPVARGLLLATAAGTAIGAIAVAASDAVPEPSCMQPSPRLAEVWSPERSAAIEAAFTATNLAFAADAWARTRPVLDTYAVGWAAMRASACAATHDRGTQSPAMLEVRLACLERGLDELAALVDDLAAPDEAVVTRAIEASRRLRPLDECADEARMLARITRAELGTATPASPERHARFARAEAAHRIGRHAAALPEAQAVAAEADADGQLELAAQAYMLVAKLENRRGKIDAAIAAAKLAIDRAEQLGDVRLRAEAQTHLVVVLAEARAFDRAQDWAQLTGASVLSLGDPPALRAGLLVAEGNLLEMSGQHAQAVERRREALALETEILDVADPTLAIAHHNLGRSLVELGRADEGRVELETALRLRKDALGPSHPDVARSYLSLSEALQASGRVDEAVEMARLAVATAERALGAEHVFVGRARGTLGVAIAQTATPAGSIPELRRAVEILTKVKGPDDIEVGYGLGNLGRVLAEVDPVEAIAVCERALAIHDAVLGVEGHADTVYVLDALAESQAKAGRWQDAWRTASRAVQMGERTVGAGHATVAEALYVRGRAERALGRFADARASLTASVERFAALDLRRARLAQSRIELALACDDDGDVDEARRQMLQSRQEIDADPGATEDLRLRIAGWLAAHGGEG